MLWLLFICLQCVQNWRVGVFSSVFRARWTSTVETPGFCMLCVFIIVISPNCAVIYDFYDCFVCMTCISSISFCSVCAECCMSTIDPLFPATDDCIWSSYALNYSNCYIHTTLFLLSRSGNHRLWRSAECIVGLQEAGAWILGWGDPGVSTCQKPQAAG